MDQCAAVLTKIEYIEWTDTTKWTELVNRYMEMYFKNHYMNIIYKLDLSGFDVFLIVPKLFPRSSQVKH